MKNRAHLAIERVSLTYESGTEALKSVSISVERGEFVAILGPSGCGKSTLLRVMAGLVSPTEGAILLNDELHTSPSRRVGIIFQQSTLFSWLTVSGNIAFALKVRSLDEEKQKDQTQNLINLVSLDGFGSVRPNSLSGGMVQRVSLARALATEPEILLMDEPFSSLDALSRLQMHEVLLGVWKRLGMSIVFVTHDVDEAVSLADRIFIMTQRPGTIAGEIEVKLKRPRIRDGIVCKGFEKLRNKVAASANDLYFNRRRKTEF